jgi:hypothetical protein
MKIPDEDELDMKCALANKVPCIFMRFLISQEWVTDTTCPILESAKEEFEKKLREIEHEKNGKEFPDEV